MEEYTIRYGVTSTFNQLNPKTNGLQNVTLCYAGNIIVESDLKFGECQKTIQNLAKEAVNDFSVQKSDDSSEFLGYIFDRLDGQHYGIIDANINYANKRIYELKGAPYEDKNLLGPYAPRPTYEAEINHQIMLLNGGDSLSHLTTEEKVDIIKKVTGKEPVTQNPPPKKMQ